MLQRLFTLLFLLWAVVVGVQAQAPQAFKYQTVVRNKLGKVLTNRIVNFRISIVQGNINGTPVYTEVHNATTNDYGLINLNIGGGAVVTGDFSTIDWGIDAHFVQVEIDINGGSNYELMGSSQLLSVPYALYAERAGSAGGSVTDLDSDTTNELQSISKTGNTVTLSHGGGSFTDEVNDADASTSNELQTLSISGNQLTISSGNTVTLPTGSGGGQTLTRVADSLYLSNNGGTVSVNDADANPSNELQTISKTGSTVTLSNGGGSFTDDNTMQTLSIAGNQLSISSGNTVTLPSGGGGTLDNAYDFGGAGAGRTINVDAAEVQMLCTTSNGIALRTTNSSTGVAIIAATTTAGNTFSAIQSSTNSTSSNAAAVIGNTTGNAWGVSGQVAASATAQAAVYGSNLRTSGGHGVMGIGFNGVVGQTNYSSGYALYAENYDNIAPLGDGAGVAGRGFYGVFGEDRYLGTVAGAMGVYSNGDLAASGGKLFQIDHPQDPENKFLRHFSVESNEVLNMYRGTTAFDANGEAVVELPTYFDAINRNVSYQLTPIGDYAPLFIKQKVQNGKFVIGGGKAGMEVSWTVHAERNDAYYQQYPEKRAVELEKRPDQKGTYLMPQLYGQPAEKAMLQRPQQVTQQPLNVKE